ncbi:MAG: DUF2723 domain-containing protein [Elusimicrobia bacterium]|nr:DUF2723 domain-containing protein [Elusimicrobiota bacterium]
MIKERVAVSLSALAVWGFYLFHLAPSVTVGDSGEFITAAVTLSLPHAPSYPLFSLTGKLFHGLVPWADGGYRLNLLSAFFSVMSALMMFLVSRRMGVGRGGALFAAFLLAGTPAFFHNGLITEVFALNTFLALCLFGSLLIGGAKGLGLSSLTLGLALANHHTILMVVPGGLLMGIGTARSFFQKKTIGLLLISFLLGFSLYAFLPLRSKQNPPLDWGNPETTSGLLRTLLRKDYGSFSLALGEKPVRSVSVCMGQEKRFFSRFLQEVSPAGVVLVLAGAVLCWRRNRTACLALLASGFFTGPFFAWLGNLPFDGQSDGVLERFYILPVTFAVFFAGWSWDALQKRFGRMGFLLLLLPLFLFARSGKAMSHRHDFMTLDYSTDIFRSLPPQTAFFMDGGDDTFFSMAFQRFARKQREDLFLFDRGGLIFASAYGPDFRRMPKPEKDMRRWSVETSWLGRGPVFYSTMNEKIHPNVPLKLDGFLYQAGEAGVGASDLWEMYVFRSVYPPAGRDYRTIALAPYFPYMRAKALWRAGERDAAMAYLSRAQRMGSTVPWLRANLSLLYQEFAFQSLQREDWARAEKLYLRCLSLDPRDAGVLVNMGVLWERRGEPGESVSWYERALKIDGENVNALYNLAVAYWRRGEWERVVPLLKEVLRLAPGHAEALRHLPIAQNRLNVANGRERP